MQADLISRLACGTDTSVLQLQLSNVETILRSAPAARKMLQGQLESAQGAEKIIRPELERLLQLAESFRENLAEAEKVVTAAYEELNLGIANLRTLGIPSNWALRLKIAFSQDSNPVPNPLFARPDEDQAPGRSGRVHEALGGFRRALLNYVDDWQRVIRALLGTPEPQPPAAEPQPAGEPQPAPEPEKLEGWPIKSHAEIERLRREKDQW